MSNISSNLNNGVFKYSINNQQNANQKVNSGNNKLPDANWVSVGTVENLTIDEIMDMFAHGNLTKTEMEKWLVYHRKDINNLSYTEQNGLITYKFEYKGKEFKIQCSTEAAADQKDQKTQETFLLSTLKNVYRLTDKQISENFVAAVSVGGNAQCYALDPKSGIETIAELVEALNNTGEPEGIESAIVCAAANTNGGDIDVDGLDIDYTQLFPEDYRNMIQTHLGQTIQELGEKAKSKNLSLVFDEIEVNKGRIVAQDEDGMYYYLNKLDNEFVRLKPEDWTQIVLTGKAKVADESGNKTDFQMFIATDFRTDKDKYINMSDVTRCINRELTLTGVSTYAIFKRNDSINIDDLYALSNSNDAGVQKLFKKFNEAFEKYGCVDDVSKKDVLTSIIILLNNKYGIPNTSPVTLSKELVKTLNAKGEETNSGVIYNEIGAIVDYQTMEFKYGLDGEFGNVTGTSNSRLASALFALQERSDSTKIIEKIKESMQWNSNLTKVTVTVPSGKTVSLSIKADSKDIYGPNRNTEILGRILAALKGTSAYQEDYFKSFFGENADIKTSANPESSSVSAILNGIQTAQEGTDPYSAVFKIDTKQAIKDVNNQTVNLTTISNAYGVGRGYAITSVNSDTVEIYQLCEKKSYTISKDVFSKNIQFGSITTMGVEPQEDTPASQVNNDTDNNDQAERTEESITAEYIILNLTALSKSSNTYVKSFITTLKNAFTTYSCTTDEQKTKMAKRIWMQRMKIADADMIAVNDVSKPGQGFETDTNAMLAVTKDGKVTKLDFASKYEIAGRLLTIAEEKICRRR